MRFTLCDGKNVNSYGFRTDLDGMDLERFRTNPVMLYSHDSDHVIGRWEDIELTDGCLTAEAVFDMDDPDAAEIAGKVERGFLKGASIGIIIRDMKEVGGVLTATQSELLEASVCAIPSDKNAIVLYDDNHTKLCFDEVKLSFNISNMNEQEIEQMQAALVELQAKVDEANEANKALAELNDNLQAQLAAAHEREVETFLTGAVREGKIAASELESYRRLSGSDFDTVRELIEARPARPSASLADMARNASQKTTLTWDELDRSGGLLKLKQENPEEFQRLYNEKFGKQ